MKALLNRFLTRLFNYEPGLVDLIKSMVRLENVPLTMKHYDYAWSLLPDGHKSPWADEQVGTTFSMENVDKTDKSEWVDWGYGTEIQFDSQHPDQRGERNEGIVFNKKAFAAAKEFTDQQVNLHHQQQLGLGRTATTPLFRFDAVAFLLAETAEKEVKHSGAPTPRIKFKWDAVALVGRVLESYMIKTLRCAVLCANHAGRVVILPKDLHLARRILGEESW